MSTEQFWTLVVVVVLVWLVVRHQIGLRRYPQIGCSRCHGAGYRTAWIWHVQSLRPRKVRGECPRCHTNAWTDRRRSGSGWG